MKGFMQVSCRFQVVLIINMKRIIGLSSENLCLSVPSLPCYDGYCHAALRQLARLRSAAQLLWNLPLANPVSYVSACVCVYVCVCVWLGACRQHVHQLVHDHLCSESWMNSGLYVSSFRWLGCCCILPPIHPVMLICLLQDSDGSGPGLSISEHQPEPTYVQNLSLSLSLSISPFWVWPLTMYRTDGERRVELSPWVRATMYLPRGMAE